MYYLFFVYMKLVAVLNRMENSKEIDNCYLTAIKKFGGVPILINDNNLDVLSFCGSILLTGGDKKGALDDYLIKYALDNNLALLGICQGMQSMAMYGTKNKLIDVDNHYRQEHYVYLEKSNLRRIIGTNKILVNSYHHQQIKNSKVFKIVGKSLDGVIEAVENEKHPFQIGVQWHPERMTNKVEIQKLFKEFLLHTKICYI